MRKLLLAACASAALLLVGAAAAAAEDGGLSAVRAGTAQFQRLDAAKAAHYDTKVIDVDGIACIDDPTGGMGIHYLNGHLLDGTIDAATPEAVIYEPTPDGRMRLVAVEYIVLKSAWDEAQGMVDAPAPALFGQPFTLTPAGNRYGLPDFYELHAWVWKNNPLGMFNDWNPNVSCASA
jgi:hypothetical protein